MNGDDLVKGGFVGALKQLEAVSFQRPVSIEPPAIKRRLVTVEQLADIMGRTPNAIRMLEKRGTLVRIQTKERRVLFDLLESVKALGHERAILW